MRRGLESFLVLAAVALWVAAAAGARNAVWAVPAVALGAFWFAGVWRDWQWAADVGLAGMAGTFAIGVAQGLGPGWAVAGLVLALSAWDLSRSSAWVAAADASQALRLTRQHLLRLGLVDAAAVCLASAALVLRVRVGVGLAVLLGLLLLLGVNRALAFLRRQAD